MSTVWDVTSQCANGIGAGTQATADFVCANAGVLLDADQQ